MSIKIDDQTRQDLEKFWQWIEKNDEQWFQKHQEQILTCLALLINQQFRDKITVLRSELNVPKDWYTTRKHEDNYAEYLEYCESNPDKELKQPHDKRITDICDKLNINVKRYYDFIVDYMYYSHPWVLITPHYEYFEHYHADDEYRYKATIEPNYYEPRKRSLGQQPKTASIHIYNNTTKNGMKNFIDANWDKIKEMQQYLDPYPHKKKYGKFKRDIFIYLLHLKGNKTFQIDEALIAMDVNNELLNEDIRQIIVDLEKQIGALLPRS